MDDMIKVQRRRISAPGAARIAKNDIEKTWGGTAYTRVTKRGAVRLQEGAVQIGIEVQVALVKQRPYDWAVTTFHPWFTVTDEYMSDSGSGIGNGFATEADAVAVARAVIKADWFSMKSLRSLRAYWDGVDGRKTSRMNKAKTNPAPGTDVVR